MACSGCGGLKRGMGLSYHNAYGPVGDVPPPGVDMAAMAEQQAAVAAAAAAAAAAAPKPEPKPAGKGLFLLGALVLLGVGYSLSRK